MSPPSFLFQLEMRQHRKWHFQKKQFSQGLLKSECTSRDTMEGKMQMHTKHKLMLVLKRTRGTYFLDLQALLGPKAGFTGQAGRVEVVVFLATSLFQVCLELFSPSPIGGSIIREQYKIWGIYTKTHAFACKHITHHL